MVDSKRVAEFEKITSLSYDDNNTYIACDNIVEDNTENISYSSFINEITNDTTKANTYRMSKSISGSYLIINISSVLYAEKNITTPLFDGLRITTNRYTTTDIPHLWQDKCNTINKPPLVFLKFNNNEMKPIYNGKAYVTYGLIGLDVNTIWNKEQSFVFNAKLDAWLLFKNPESYTWVESREFEKAGSRIMYRVGTTVDSTIYSLVYTLLGENYFLPMGDVSLCGESTISPLAQVKNGEIQSFSSVPVTFTNIGGRFIYTLIESTVTGVFSQTKGNTFAPYPYSTSLQGTRIKYELTPTITSSTNATETITKRYGYYFHIII